MEINCEEVVKKYLLNKNPLYAFSFPISILVGIIIFGCCKAYNWSDNSYVNQILIPILAFLLSMVFIDIIARLMISKHELNKLVQLCNLWMHDPTVKNHPILSKIIDMNLVSSYNAKSIESFSNFQELKTKENPKFVNNQPLAQPPVQLTDPIAEIPSFSPSPLEYKTEQSQCIENSNCCNLCSGSNENPCNLVSPIPGPQWLPRTAEAVQNNLVNNNYTNAKC